jgi:hypothetical protein
LDFASLKESAEMLIVGASAVFLVDLDEFAPWALAMITAKYGRNIAPMANITVSQPSGTLTARTMQTTLMIIATVYLIKRLRRSSTGETSKEVTD